MNTVTTDTQTNPQMVGRTVCIWKLVLLDNLQGRGTSFDPSRLTPLAFRCLRCDGFAGNCRMYTA